MFRIDATSYVPIYEQIKLQIRSRIALGILPPHALLPSIRELATSLLINPNTVARAYKDLEKEGLILSRRGRGCFVAGESQSLIEKEREAWVDRIFDSAIDEAKRLDLTYEEMKRIFKNRLQRAKALPGKE